MNLKKFSEYIASFDSPVILLEGSRTVEKDHLKQITRLAEKLAHTFPNATFRLGNAEGSDNLFAEGISKVNPAQLEMILPNDRKLKSTQKERRISFDSLPDDEIKDICKITKEATPANRALIEYYEKGLQGVPQIKAKYLLRDALKVVGSKQLELKPANFALFYLNSTKKTGGGTGHTIRVCKSQNVPFQKQEDWLEW